MSKLLQKSIVPIDTLIRIVRGQKVILDSDLARLYGIETRALNQAVRRNLERFPSDFMFELELREAEPARSQTVILKGKNIKYQHLAFTEHGIAILSSVLRSPRAVQMNIAIIRAFIRLRDLMATHKDLAAKVEKLEQGHQQTGAAIETLIEDIDKLAGDIHWIKNPPLTPKRRMGYIVGGKDD